MEEVDIVDYVYNMTRDLGDMRELSNFLFVFSISLIIVVGVIAFIETVVALWNSENSQTIVKKTLTTLLYSIVLTASGIFWLNFFWQKTTGNVLLFDAPTQYAHCLLLICRQ